jgi:basic membrane lipoprotein Med (substrate-binding protein (PBP1-ABC) superfamily)
VVSTTASEPLVRTEPPEETWNLLNIITAPNHLNVAFVHQRTPEASAWTSSHEAGRLYLEEALGKSVTTWAYFNANNNEQADEILAQAVARGADVVFTTTPQLIAPSLKASVNHPKVRFLNCSVDMPYSSVRTYYSRIYEAKFITGAIAGAMTKDGRIGYVGSNPIHGVPASINAFALGAQMTNPDAKIHLKWSCLPGKPIQEFLDDGILVISNRDAYSPERRHHEYGTYMANDDNILVPLVSPHWVWGKFYENVIRSILSGSWDAEKSTQAVNHWWGMNSGVIDVEFSDSLPEGVKILGQLLRKGLREGTLDPFLRKIVSQDGIVRNDGTQTFTPETLLHMDWLCENVIGGIPDFQQLLPFARPTVRLLSIHPDQIPPEEVTH